MEVCFSVIVLSVAFILGALMEWLGKIFNNKASK